MVVGCRLDALVLDGQDAQWRAASPGRVEFHAAKHYALRVSGRPASDEWKAWIRGMGRYTRRLRELAGLSQETLARRAGVSQGAVSRLEAGRAVNTPLIAVMKINAAMRDSLATLGADKLSKETRRLMQVPARGTPSTEEHFDALPVAADPLLEEFVPLFWQLPGRHRASVVEIVRLMTGVLTTADGAGPSAARGRRRQSG